MSDMKPHKTAAGFEDEDGPQTVSHRTTDSTDSTPVTEALRNRGNPQQQRTREEGAPASRWTAGAAAPSGCPNCNGDPLASFVRAFFLFWWNLYLTVFRFFRGLFSRRRRHHRNHRNHKNHSRVSIE